MITVEKAREVLGEEFINVDDESIIDLIQLMIAVCRYVINEDENGNIED